MLLIHFMYLVLFRHVLSLSFMWISTTSLLQGWNQSRTPHTHNLIALTHLVHNLNYNQIMSAPSLKTMSAVILRSFLQHIFWVRQSQWMKAVCFVYPSVLDFIWLHYCVCIGWYFTWQCSRMKYSIIKRMKQVELNSVNSDISVFLCRPSAWLRGHWSRARSASPWRRLNFLVGHLRRHHCSPTWRRWRTTSLRLSASPTSHAALPWT